MKRIITVAIALLCAGCVQTSVSMLDENTAIISGKGSAFNSVAAVQQDTLVSAEHLTLARGFRYFVIVTAQDRTRQGTIIIPGHTYSNGTVTGSATTFGNTTIGSASYSSNSYTTPAQAINLIKPGEDITIRMFKDGQIAPTQYGVWDANSIMAANK